MVSSKDEKVLVNQVLLACTQGDLAKLKSLMNIIDIDFYQSENRDIAKKIYKQACLSNNLDIVEELIYLTNGDENISFIKDIFEYLIDSKKQEYYPIISYLVNEPKLELMRAPLDKISFFYGSVNFQLELAGRNDNLPLVKALLNTNEPLKRNKWVFNTTKFFKIACENNNIEVLKYLYTEPKFQDILNPLLGLMEACRADNSKAVQFILFDYKIEKTKELEDYLKKSGNKNIIQMIEKRDLNNELNNELEYNTQISKTLKV